MFWIHVSWKGWFESLKLFPSLDLCITKGVESWLPIVPSLNLWIRRGLIWETQFAYLLAGHWIYGTLYAFWWILDSICWGPLLEWPFVRTHWILGFTIDFSRLNQLEDLGVLFFHSFFRTRISVIVSLGHIFNPCCWRFFLIPH